MKVSRRRFLQGATAGALLGPSIFNHALVRNSLANSIGSKHLVVVFLDGGNDGISTICPVDDGGATLRQAYEAHRDTGSGGTRLLSGNLLPIGVDANTGANLGLHPSLQGLHDIHTTHGSVAFIQGCGYPEYSLSHDESRGIWETASPRGGSPPGGWVGRHLAAGYGPTDVPAVAVNWNLPGDFRNTGTSVLTMKRVEWAGFPYDWRYGGDTAAKRAAFEAIHAEAGASAQKQLGYIGQSGTSTLISSEAYPQLHDLYRNARPSWDAQYEDLDTAMADDFREIAKIMYGVQQGVPNVTARYFQCSKGGYDTHSDQGGDGPEDRLSSLHSEVADALKVFYEDLDDMGIIEEVAILVWSEFSRRIQQNDSGTDHGSQGPMILLGGKVRGGIFGNHPNINAAALDDSGNTPYSQDGADPFRSLDFRDVYGGILKQWVGMSQGDVLSLLPLDVGPASEYWTVENFDMDLFLP